MKGIPVAIIIGAVFVGGAILLANDTREPAVKTTSVNNVHMEGGIQIIEIDAKGGYLPRKSIAKAGVPTIIRFNTEATFDCSASVRIPALNVSKILPQTGSTDIDIGSQNVGPLQGSCGMGMYPFEVIFE